MTLRSTASLLNFKISDFLAFHEGCDDMNPFTNSEKCRVVENSVISRFLLLVLITLGVSCILSAIIFPEITWVLVICFLYIFALEAILLTTD
jgi:hypothetical protein